MPSLCMSYLSSNLNAAERANVRPSDYSILIPTPGTASRQLLSPDQTTRLS